MFLLKGKERAVLSVSISFSAVRALFFRLANEEIVESKGVSFGAPKELLGSLNGDVSDCQGLSSIVEAIAMLRQGAGKKLVVLLSIPDTLTYWFVGRVDQVEIFKTEMSELSALRRESTIESIALLDSPRNKEKRYLYIAARESVVVNCMRMLGCLCDSIELIVPQHLTHIFSFGCAGIASQQDVRLFLGGECDEGGYSLWSNGALITRGAYEDYNRDLAPKQSVGADWIEVFCEKLCTRFDSAPDEVCVSGALGKMVNTQGCMPRKAVSTPFWLSQDVLAPKSMEGIRGEICTGRFDECLGLLSLYDENVLRNLFRRISIED